MSKIPYRIYLSEEEIPKQWYNLRADMKEQPDPYINYNERNSSRRLISSICQELARQEMDAENRYIDIPEKVLNFYKIYRPSTLSCLQLGKS